MIREPTAKNTNSSRSVHSNLYSWQNYRQHVHWHVRGRAQGYEKPTCPPCSHCKSPTNHHREEFRYLPEYPVHTEARMIYNYLRNASV